MRTPIVKGKNVNLRKINRKDTDTVLAWRNSEDLGRFLRRKNKLTKQFHIDFLKKYFKKNNDFYFIAEIKDSKIPIGTVAIYDVDFLSKRAEFGRLLVDDKYRVFAFEISFLAMQFGFEILKLNKIYGAVQKENKKTLRFDLGLGFREEGLLKHHWWNGEKFDDIIPLAIFSDGYRKLKEKYHNSITWGNKDKQRS